KMTRSRIYLAITVIALSILSAVQGIRATESSEVDSTINSVEEPFSQTGHVSLPVPWGSDENLSFGAVTETHDEDIAHQTAGDAESASELNRKLSNPVSSGWAIESQFKNILPDTGTWNTNRNLQPAMPTIL